VINELVESERNKG